MDFLWSEAVSGYRILWMRHKTATEKMKSEVAFRQSVLVPQNMENYFAIWKLSVIIKYTEMTEIHYKYGREQAL